MKRIISQQIMWLMNFTNKSIVYFLYIVNEFSERCYLRGSKMENSPAHLYLKKKHKHTVDVLSHIWTHTLASY